MFSGATFFAKLAMLGSDVNGLQIAFVRFVVGLLVAIVYVRRTGISLRPKKLRYVALRAITNTIAVMFLFAGIQFTTVTNANMLNMTYPVFVFMVAPFVTGERTRLLNYLFLAITAAGIYMVVCPDFSSVNPGDLLALSSGVAAGFAISFLRQARKYDDSGLILFYLMAIGLPLSFVLALPGFVVPEGLSLLWVVLSASLAVAGQWSLTIGYRHIEATSGALVSASRIPLAAMLGISFLGESAGMSIIVGGVLIFAALAGVSLTGRRELSTIEGIGEDG